MQYSLNRDHQHLKWQQQKSWISYPDRQGVQGKQRTQYLLIPRSKWKMLQNYWCPDIWVRLPRHKWPVSWSSMEDPVVPLERNLYGHPLAGLLMGKAIWENPIETWLGEGFQVGMLIRSPWRRVILICVCGRHQIGWKETKHWPNVESTCERNLFGRTNIILDHVYLGCTQRQCEISKDIVDNCRTMFEYRISAGSTETLPCSENLSISSWSNDMEGHAK